MMLCDGAAHTQVWCSTGESGDRFCTMCSNVRSFAPPQAPPNDVADSVEILCQPMAYHQLNLVTDEELLASWQRLDHRQLVCTKADFAKWQMATGLSWSKHALALNASLLEAGILKPTSQFCHDWMHGILQGTAPMVLLHVLQILASHLDIWIFWNNISKKINSQLQPNVDMFILYFPKKWKSARKIASFLAQHQKCWPFIKSFDASCMW